MSSAIPLNKFVLKYRMKYKGKSKQRSWQAWKQISCCNVLDNMESSDNTNGPMIHKLCVGKKLKKCYKILKTNFTAFGDTGGLY